MAKPTTKTKKHRIRSLEVYVSREARVDEIIKATERDILTLLLSVDPQLRSLPSTLREIDRILAVQEKALLKAVSDGLTDMGTEAASHAIDAQ